MKKSRFLILPLLLTLYTILSAHEFWLQPAKYFYKKGESATIRFRVGEDFDGKNWTGARPNVNFLYLYGNGSPRDIANLISGHKGDSLQLELAQDGTYNIGYNGRNASIELDAAKFNAYLEEDGLRDALDYRRIHQEMDSAGRERYQRSAKTMVQVGEKYDSSYKQAGPLPLDIIPLQHPYLVRDRQKMTVKVLFEKKPLADQLIRIWYREDNRTIREEILTGPDGLASFKIKRSGRWMISTVHMIRLRDDPDADWQSYWGSFTWGYE